jgi:O-antigen/teichoic acid export membrane protein
VCTGLITFFFIPGLFSIKWQFDGKLLKQMLGYSWPILILGIAGILNQVADKIIFPLVYPNEAEANVQLGVYGSCVKIAMIMAMITQAFRFAYEPIVFAGIKDKDQHEMYTKAMKYFIIFTLLAFLIVVGYIDLLKYIVRNSDYWVGLKVVPIVMAAEIMMGIYFNLSFWYKVIDKTIWGAIFSGIGCAVLLLVNIIFVPRYGYMACAWGGFAGYGVAMLASYFVGQKYYPLNYPMKDIALYVVLAIVLFFSMRGASHELPVVLSLGLNTLLILLFAAIVVRRDLPLSKLPVIGKYFRQ